MTCPSVVRVGTLADWNEVWRLTLMAHHENGGPFSVDMEKSRYFIQRALAPQMIDPRDAGPRGVIGVIGPSEKLEGLVVLFIGSYWYSAQQHLEEFIVFVDPECRKSLHARTLIKWMKRQSDLTGIPLLTGVLANNRTEAKVKLYDRMLPRAGAFFLYGVKGATAASSAAFA